MSETPKPWNQTSPERDRIVALETKLAELLVAVTALEAAVLRMASYQGVAHTLKDPRV